jgi:uncharacterized protein
MVLPKPIKFEWDQGNTEKNPKKHGVRNEETEEVFFDRKKKIAKDILHSALESRYILLGKTKKDVKLFIVFTVRSSVIRVISSRRLNAKEAHLYEKTT